MGSVYRKGKRLYFKVKVDGVWRAVRTEFVVGQERQAEVMLERLEARRAAGVEAIGDLGPVTVSRFATAWIEGRKQHVRTWKNDDAVLRLHVLPTLGPLRLVDVRARHIVELVKGWRSKPDEERLAPKSIYNAYSTVSALFRDAELEGLIDADPCRLTKHQLGPKVDADPEWRMTALFTLAELEQLVSDDRVSMDRRVLYALEGIAGLRHGEAAGLLWRNVQSEVKPLGMLYVAFNYERPLPKGDVCRPTPIHPTLAAILAEWRLHGWARMFGRPPNQDDLVLPLPPESQSKFGRWRRKGYSFDRLERDLETLGLRHRRGHDLRRTMISLCRSNGANRDILRRATHKPPREVMEGYTTFEWEVVCAEVAKHPIRRASPAQVIPLKQASGGGPTSLVRALVPSPASSCISTEESMALPGLEQGKQRGGGTELARAADSSASDFGALAASSVRVDPIGARLGGTKVPSPPADLVRELLELALKAGVSPAHPALAQARAWLKGLGQ